MHRSLTSALCGIVLSGAFLMGGSLQGAVQDRDTAPDNTRVNKADRDNSQPTADQAKNNKSDRELQKEDRKSVV